MYINKDGDRQDSYALNTITNFTAGKFEVKSYPAKSGAELKKILWQTAWVYHGSTGKVEEIQPIYWNGFKDKVPVNKPTCK